jgi:hypothetical protein
MRKIPIREKGNGQVSGNDSENEVEESMSKRSMGTMKMAPKDSPKKKNLMGNSNNDKFTIRIMSYNIWGGGANEQKQVNETVAVILAAKADIIGVQETRLESDPCTAESCPAMGNSVAGTIADSLGFTFTTRPRQTQHCGPTL